MFVQSYHNHLKTFQSDCPIKWKPISFPNPTLVRQFFVRLTSQKMLINQTSHLVLSHPMFHLFILDRFHSHLVIHFHFQSTNPSLLSNSLKTCIRPHISTYIMEQYPRLDMNPSSQATCSFLRLHVHQWKKCLLTRFIWCQFLSNSFKKTFLKWFKLKKIVWKIEFLCFWSGLK